MTFPPPPLAKHAEGLIPLCIHHGDDCPILIGRTEPRGLEIDPRTGCSRFHGYDPKGGGCMAGSCPNSTGPDVGA